MFTGFNVAVKHFCEYYSYKHVHGFNIAVKHFCEYYSYKRCPIIVHKIIVHKRYLYIYARANCASRSSNFVNKNKNTCVSDNNPFDGKRMGRHINIKLLS